MNKLVYEIGTAFDEIEAGRQRMATFVTTFAELDDPRSWFHAIADVAFGKGWVVTLFHDADAKFGTAVRVFVGEKEEIWRVPALIAVRETGFVEGVWSKNAEARQHALLGISAARAHRRIAALPPAELVYAVLDEEQRARVELYGGRSFGTPEEVAGLTIARSPLRSRKNTLVRVAVRSVDALLGRKLSLRLSRPQVARLHAAMVDRVEVQTRRGWR